MNDGVIRRLNRDKRDLTARPIDGVTISFPKNNLEEWFLQVEAPEGSIYEGDTFDLIFTFGSDYPDSPPRIRMLTPIVHPNIEDGAVCLDVIRDPRCYSKAITVRKIIEALIIALQKPNAKDRLNVRVGDLMDRDMEEFKRQAREQVSLNIMNRAESKA